MRICSISDTHGAFAYIPDDIDVLTISGDISPCERGYGGVTAQRGYFYEKFIPYYSNKAKHVVFIAGNHDLFLERLNNDQLLSSFRESLPANVHYLCNSGVDIDGASFWGTPYVPTFCRWSFMLPDNEDGLGLIYKNIPDNIDVMLAHGPAYRHNDTIGGNESIGDHLGSKMLLQYVKRHSPKYLFVGHIHTGCHLYTEIRGDDRESVTMSCNVSILDEQYEPHFEEHIVNV